MTILARVSNTTLMARAAAVGADREAGASELLARALPLLEEAIAAGRDTVLRVAQQICLAQPAMAPLWIASAVAMAEFQTPGRFARVRAEMERAPSALARAATDALTDALAGQARPQILTLSYSSSVARALSAIARRQALEVVCARSDPGGEGGRLRAALVEAGADATLAPDAMLTTYLPTATAVVVGADAISARDWSNKCGTFGLAAAASHLGTPVYVIGSRDKAQSAALHQRVQLPREFEQTPIGLATLVLTDVGPVAPEDVPALAERYSVELSALLALL
jgi:translation initiation factor 2B subunit (eIF-2B alpha/beta/delta family)